MTTHSIKVDTLKKFLRFAQDRNSSSVRYKGDVVTVSTPSGTSMVARQHLTVVYYDNGLPQPDDSGTICDVLLSTSLSIVTLEPAETIPHLKEILEFKGLKVSPGEWKKGAVEAFLKVMEEHHCAPRLDE